MIRDKVLIRRLNRIIPEWRAEDGTTNANETVRKAVRLEVLKRLNLMYEVIVYEDDLDIRNKMSHRSAADVWALMQYMEACCKEIGEHATQPVCYIG